VYGKGNSGQRAGRIVRAIQLRAIRPRVAPATGVSAGQVCAGATGTHRATQVAQVGQRKQLVILVIVPRHRPVWPRPWG
jgi:hypothetical protein